MNSKQRTLTVVIPVYKNAATVDELQQRLFQATENLFKSVELLFVIDASPDNSEEIIHQLATSNPNIKYIVHARNFGQHTALMTGLLETDSDFVALIDADLEEPPEKLPELYKALNDQTQIALGVRIDNERSVIRKFISKLYTLIYNLLTDYPMIDNSMTIRVMTREYTEFLRQFSERAFLPGFVSWIGMPIALIPIKWHDQQRQSSYSIRSLLSHARVGIIGFSGKLMRLAFYCGFIMSLFAILYGLFMVWNYFRLGNVPPGFTSIVVLISLFCGVQLCVLGLLGEYIQEVFLMVKNRPRALILKKNY